MANACRRHGTSTGPWTFNASLLNKFGDNIKGSQDEQCDRNGQLLGQTSDVSIFKVTDNGTEVDGGVATTTRVGVATVDPACGVGAITTTIEHRWALPVLRPCKRLNSCFVPALTTPANLPCGFPKFYFDYV